MNTEILGIEIGDGTGRLGGWIPAPNLSGFYHWILIEWCRLLSINGNVLLVGETGENGGLVGKMLKGMFPDILKVATIDLHDADYCADISSRNFKLGGKWDFIICQAVLEHVVNPMGAIYNMNMLASENGCIIIHTHGPDFWEHRYPIDCIRFLRDFS